MQRHGTGQIFHRFAVSPFLHQITDSQKKHDGTGSIKITSDKCGHYRSSIQDVYIQFSSPQRTNRPEDKGNCLHRIDEHTHRKRQEKPDEIMPCNEPEHPVLILMLNLPARVFGHFYIGSFIIKSGERTNDILALNRSSHIMNGCIRCALFNPHACHSRQLLQIILDFVRLLHGHIALMQVNAQTHSAFM